MSLRPLEGHPAINYPCRWFYRIICTDQGGVRQAIVRIVGEAEHSLSDVGEPSSGRYHRMELVVHVRDERHRNEIFEALTKTPTVRFVL